MRSRRSANGQVAEVARRRLELLSAELAEIRPDPVDTPVHRPAAGPASSPPRAADPSGVPGRHAHRPVGRLASAGGWTHDRLPPTLQGRVALGPAHLAVLALVVAAALALGAWWALRAGGRETALPVVSSAPALAAVPTQAPAARPSAPGGGGDGPVAGSPAAPQRRHRPEASSSTSPARSAGRASPPCRWVPGSSTPWRRPVAPGRGSAPGTLNLARVLADGEQIVVGVPAPPGVAASAAGAPAAGAAGGSATATPLVNLNSATQADLELLPGVGPVTARSILTFRSENGAFTSVDELLEVSGIGDATLAEIAPFVTL